jgi:tRNA A-37 threonylcarbamoyl transferase component Bud32
MTTTSSDRMFGEIAVLKGYLTRELLGKALTYQQSMPHHQPLGQILASKGVLSPAQVRDVADAQQRRISGGFTTSQGLNEARNIPIRAAHSSHVAHGQTPPQAHYSPNPMASPPARPNSGPYNRVLPNNGTQSLKGPSKLSKAVPPGVDESVIDDEGNVEIIGRTIGGCQVTKKIGQGAMGFIFLANHANLNRQVVVKILPPKAAMTKKNLERFLREARAAAKLEHPNIVQVLNVDKSPEGLYFIIMQFVDGKDLGKIVAEKGAQSWQESTRIIFEAASGLKIAHDNEIIHRDIKAENIMLTQNGVTKVTDFGLAKDLNSNLKLTADGAFIGTPLYMAPEIGRVPQIDGRVDIFSLGVTYYYLLTGIQPFRGFKTLEILSARAHDKVKPPEKYLPGLPKNVRRLLAKMLAKDRDDRYLSMTELIKDLQALQAGLPIQAGPPTLPLWAEQGLPVESKDAGPEKRTKTLGAVIAIGALIILVLVSAIAILSMS